MRIMVLGVIGPRTRAHFLEHVITPRPRNEEDGRQVVEGLQRKAHIFRPFMRGAALRRNRPSAPNSSTTTRGAGISWQVDMSKV